MVSKGSMRTLVFDQSCNTSLCKLCSYIFFFLQILQILWTLEGTGAYGPLLLTPAEAWGPKSGGDLFEELIISPPRKIH